MFTKYVDNLLIIGAIFLVIGGYLQEDPYGKRITILLIVSIAFIVIGLCRNIWKDKENGYVYIIGMIVCLAFFEKYSKFAINYFYLILYFYLVLYSIIYRSKKQGLMLSGLVLIVSFVKFTRLIYIEPTTANLSIAIFFSLVIVLLSFAVYLAKAYSSELKISNEIYKELLEAYETLEEYALKIKVLSAKEERTHIARELHDSLGHDLTGLIMQLELAHQEIKGENIETGDEYLVAGIKEARNSLVNVRRVVDTLRKRNEIVFAIRPITELIENFQEKTGGSYELNIQIVTEMNLKQLFVLYKVVQESLTNIGKHGKVNKGKIVIVEEQRKIKFQIENKIDADVEIEKGNGLCGMEERMKEINGSIKFTCSHGIFYIIGQFPLE